MGLIKKLWNAIKCLFVRNKKLMPYEVPTLVPVSKVEETKNPIKEPEQTNQVEESKPRQIRKRGRRAYRQK